MKRIKGTAFLGKRKIISLKNIVSLSKTSQFLPKKHSRICLHNSPNSKIQQMLICLNKKGKFYLHKHKGDFKSYCILYGSANVYIETNRRLKSYSLDSQNKRIIRFRPENWHTISAKSQSLVYLETKCGKYEKHKIQWKKF